MTLTLTELRKREAVLIAKEREAAGGKTQFWYLSYASDVFLGGAIVRAFGFVHACRRARDLDISPGGQVTGLPCPPKQVPDPKYLDRLLSLDELGEFWEMRKLSDLKAGR